MKNLLMDNGLFVLLDRPNTLVSYPWATGANPFHRFLLKAQRSLKTKGFIPCLPYYLTWLRYDFCYMVDFIPI